MGLMSESSNFQFKFFAEQEPYRQIKQYCNAVQDIQYDILWNPLHQECKLDIIKHFCHHNKTKGK